MTPERYARMTTRELLEVYAWIGETQLRPMAADCTYQARQVAGFLVRSRRVAAYGRIVAETVDTYLEVVRAFLVTDRRRSVRGIDVSGNTDRIYGPLRPL